MQNILRVFAHCNTVISSRFYVIFYEEIIRQVKCLVVLLCRRHLHSRSKSLATPTTILVRSICAKNKKRNVVGETYKALVVQWLAHWPLNLENARLNAVGLQLLKDTGLTSSHGPVDSSERSILQPGHCDQTLELKVTSFSQ